MCSFHDITAANRNLIERVLIKKSNEYANGRFRHFSSFWPFLIVFLSVQTVFVQLTS